MLGQIVTYGGHGYYNIVSDQGVCWAFIADSIELVLFPNRFLKGFLNGREILVTGKLVQVSSQLLEIALAVA